MRTPWYILSAILFGGVVMSTIGEAQQTQPPQRLSASRKSRDEATGNAFKAAEQPKPAQSPFEAEPQKQPAVQAERTEGETLYSLGTPNGTLRLVAACQIKTFHVTGKRGFTLELTTDDLSQPLELWSSEDGVCYSLFGVTAVSDTLTLKHPNTGECLLEATLDE